MRFAHLEKHPLTDKQYAACISEAKTTLVLAGAGTGKTSTLLGRIAYLYETEQANLAQILPLAFAVDAAQEVQQRVVQLSKKMSLSVDDLKEFKARTFHSLGLHIVETVEGKRSQLSPLINEQSLWEFVKQQVNLLSRTNLAYRQWLYHYFSYVEGGLKENVPRILRTLQDDYVLSQAELCLANFFYLMGVPYIYRAHYERDIYIDGLPYRSSFYLPESRCYIDVGSSLCSEKQRQQYYGIHQRYGTRYVFYDEKFAIDGRLFSFPLERDIARSEGRIKPLLTRLLDLLLYFKAQGISSQALLDGQTSSQTLANDSAEEQSCLLQLLVPLYQAYETHLKEQNEIDFDGMIIKAKQYIETGAFKVPWSDILIDEFQDISWIRLQLIQAMQAQQPEIRLFCVGDDWQTIYQFAGSRLSYIREIERYLGKTTMISLDKTFRFHQGLCDLSSQFIQKNPLQYRKNLNALRSTREGLVLVTSMEEKAIYQILEEIKAFSSKDVSEVSKNEQNTISCLFLARFNHDLPSQAQLAYWQRLYPLIRLRAMTIHASKGSEADYVIVLNMNAGEYGLPSEKQGDNYENFFAHVMQRILPENNLQEDYPFASERRVFYVALTRAKECVYLCYDEKAPSIFLEELKKDFVLRQLRGQKYRAPLIQYAQKLYTKVKSWSSLSLL